jgi:sulfate/thiosulfate transport system ATP-binding protein
MSISLDQVTKRYQDLPVVNDVSLQVEPGEFLVLLGPSGSGKSTLLRAIAGLIDIDHGRIALHGRDVTRLSARQREIGFVFQHYALFRHMTVADNIEFALRVRRMRAAERVARRKELLQLVALEGMDSRLPAELSGGQQQRVAVARALAHRPRVLLMDEPFGALDAKIREELRRTIRQIQRDLGMTTILVTHDQEEAFALADRIGVMHQGRLLECGRPDDLYARPASRFVATFLGAANLLLGYRYGDQVRFDTPADRTDPPDEVVTVLRPEEVELGPPGQATARPVGAGTVEEVQFGGAIERVRVRLSGLTAKSASGPDGAGALLDVTRTLTDKRAFPVGRAPRW